MYLAGVIPYCDIFCSARCFTLHSFGSKPLPLHQAHVSHQTTSGTKNRKSEWLVGLFGLRTLQLVGIESHRLGLDCSLYVFFINGHLLVWPYRRLA